MRKIRWWSVQGKKGGEKRNDRGGKKLRKKGGGLLPFRQEPKTFCRGEKKTGPGRRGSFFSIKGGSGTTFVRCGKGDKREQTWATYKEGRGKEHLKKKEDGNLAAKGGGKDVDHDRSRGGKESFIGKKEKGSGRRRGITMLRLPRARGEKTLIAEREGLYTEEGSRFIYKTMIISRRKRSLPGKDDFRLQAGGEESDRKRKKKKKKG